MTIRRVVDRLTRWLTSKGQPTPASNDTPQACVEDDGLRRCEARDWRAHFTAQLFGRGIEIGPLHRPMPTHPGMQVDYIDRCTVEQLRAQYPELNECPLVEPTVIGDAETMGGVDDGGYDFLIAAHVIEHMRNPLAALQHWRRVVKPGGLLYLLVPDKRCTFDRKRVRTTLEHLILDYESPSAERDFEHFLDYAVHVHDKGGDEALREAERLRDIDYSIHFHVFVPADIVALLAWFAAHVAPLTLVEGPTKAPGADEFHLLLQKPTR